MTRTLVFYAVFRHRMHRLRRIHHRQRLHDLAHVADPAIAWTRDFQRAGPFRHRMRRRGPSFLTLLVAGLAVFALVKLMAANRPARRRSLAEKLLLGTLLVLVGAIVLSFRRSGRRRRYGW